MTVSSIDKELVKCFIQLSEPQKESLLQMIKSFVNTGSDFADENSIENYNNELDDAMNRINAGNFITLEDLEKEMQ